MRRLVKASFLLLVVGFVLTLCSLVSFVAHSTGNHRTYTPCVNTCHNHSQAASLVDSESSEERDDTEPRPPFTYWQVSPVNLSVLYILPLLYLIVFHDNSKRLLTTHLRF